jgi:hypothetical protein
MLACSFSSAIIVAASVWANFHKKAWTATFANDLHCIGARDGLCDLLFERSSQGRHLGPYFTDSDSHQNDLSLAKLFKNVLPVEASRTQSFRAIAFYLVELERNDSKGDPKRIAAARDILNKWAATFTPDLARERFLCSECSLLLQGFIHPREAADGLRDLSALSIATSPVLSQTALVHAINLLRVAGDEAAASALFERGKRVFAPDNPTEYLNGYWHKTRQFVDHGEFVDGKFVDYTAYEFMEPHLRWRF